MDFTLLFAGVTWWKRLAESTEERARLWNKKVNLLVDCFAGYECFWPLFFRDRSLRLLNEKIFLDFLAISLFLS